MTVSLREERDSCSASQLKHRYYCPGSPRLEREMVKPARDEDKPDAFRGIVLHSLSNLLVAKTMPLEELVTGIEYNGYTLTALDCEHVAWSVGQVWEMLEETNATKRRHVVLYEHQVNLNDLGIGGGIHGNRADVAIIVPGYYCIIIDYKYGQGWVESPKWNLQFKAYAWGVWREFGGTAVMAVKLQPALEEEDRRMSYTFCANELERAGDDIKAIVDATKISDAPLVRGPQCGYCTAKDVCPHFRGALGSIPSHHHVATHLANIGPVDRRELYENLQAAQEWVGNALAACQGFLKSGKGTIAGYTIGSTTTKRKWKDDIEDCLRKLAKEHDVDPAELKATSIKSPAQMDSVFPKGAKEELAELTERPKGKPIVVPEPNYQPKTGGKNARLLV